MVSVPSFDIQPVLAGEHVQLRPLRATDYDAVYAVASDPEIWSMHPFPDRYKSEVFLAFFADAIESGGAFAIIHNATGEIIGSKLPPPTSLTRRRRNRLSTKIILFYGF